MYYNTEKIKEILLEFAKIQEYFGKEYGSKDIVSGSKFYEIIIANELNHDIIPGQSGTKDGKDTSYFESGKLRWEKYYKDGYRDGKYTLYYSFINIPSYIDWGYLRVEPHDDDYLYQYNSIPNNKDDKLTYYWMEKTFNTLYGEK